MDTALEKIRRTSIALVFAVLLAGVLLSSRAFLQKTSAAGGAVTCPADGKFHVVQAVICDPDGKPFLPKGINVGAGYTFLGFFSTPLLSDDTVTKFVDGWKFNTLRVVTCPDAHCVSTEEFGGSTVMAEDLDAVIQKWTAKKVVILLDNHSPSLGGPTGPPESNRQFAQQWFAQMATKYKNNPYVWFEPFNEPMEEEQAPYNSVNAHQEWVNFTEPVVKAIRDTGSTNIVVPCASHYGQDRAYSTGGNVVTAPESTIMSFGPALVQKYGNLVFDMHFYSKWAASDNGNIATYFNNIHNLGLAVLIGETWGDAGGSQSFMQLDQVATDKLYQVKPNGVGFLPWSDGGAYSATNGGRASDINSTTNPSNLSHNGQLHWTWTHSPPSAVPDGYTVTTGGGVTPGTSPGVTATTAPNCPKKSQGDADCNGSISLADYQLWKNQFQGTSADKTADFNADGKISLVDYSIWRTSFLGGGTTPPVASATLPAASATVRPTNQPGTDSALKITVSSANHGSVVLENSVMQLTYEYNGAGGYGEFAIDKWINKLANNRDITKQITAPRPGGVAGMDYINIENCEQFVSGGKENINKTQLTGTIINDGAAQKTVRIVQDCGITEELTIFANSPVIKVNYVSYTYDWIDNRNSRNIDKPTDHVYGQAEPMDVVIYGSDQWLQTNNYLCTGNETSFCQKAIYDRLGIGGRSDPADGGPLSYKGNFIMGFTEKDSGQPVGYGRVLPVNRLGTWWVHINESFEYLFYNLSGPTSQGPAFTGYLYMVTNGPDELLSIGKSAVDGTIVTR